MPAPSDQYIHQNPVSANLVENAEDYLYSSVRIWHRRRLENEPLESEFEFDSKRLFCSPNGGMSTSATKL